MRKQVKVTLDVEVIERIKGIGGVDAKNAFYVGLMMCINESKLYRDVVKDAARCVKIAASKKHKNRCGLSDEEIDARLAAGKVYVKLPDGMGVGWLDDDGRIPPEYILEPR
jgi:hypothetical protein